MNFPVEAIYDQGVFRPLQPLVLPQGTRVRVRLEKAEDVRVAPEAMARVFSPRLAHPEQVADFAMEVAHCSSD